jgi:SAM-dependent methyltransferase
MLPRCLLSEFDPFDRLNRLLREDLLMSTAAFDAYAVDYESSLQQGLSVSGESSDYFASGRVRWLRRRLMQMDSSLHPIHAVLDFGCGTGNSVPWLKREFQTHSLVGIDTSERSLVQARSRFASEQVRFETVQKFVPQSEMDLAYCNGVFHHIPVEQRAAAASTVFDSLRPKGWFAFWENNPWNPGTRYVMSRIPFDRDAIPMSLIEAKRLLRRVGFEVRSVDTCFYFPRCLRCMRWLEPKLSWLPLGAQYLVLAQRP